MEKALFWAHFTWFVEQIQEIGRIESVLTTIPLFYKLEQCVLTAAETKITVPYSFAYTLAS